MMKVRDFDGFTRKKDYVLPKEWEPSREFLYFHCLWKPVPAEPSTDVGVSMGRIKELSSTIVLWSHLPLVLT